MASTIEDPAKSKTIWIYYLLCEGCGLTKLIKPLGKCQQKCLCIKGGGECDVTTDIMGEGICSVDQRVCCIQRSCQLPPGTPFVECFGVRVFGGEKPADAPAWGDIADTSGMKFGHEEETFESISEDLKAAIAEEDFERAHALKQRRAVIQTGGVVSLPNALQM